MKGRSTINQKTIKRAKSNRTKEQLLKDLEVQEACVETLTSQNRGLNQDIFLLQEKLGNALVDLEATRCKLGNALNEVSLLQKKLDTMSMDLEMTQQEVSLISVEKAHLRDEIKDLEKGIRLLDEEHKKDLQTLEQEHQKKVQYLKGVGSGLSHAISVIVSGCTVPVNEK